MKFQNINWRKGFFRMTLVVSILLGLLGLFVGLMLSSGNYPSIPAKAVVLFVAIPVGFVWLVYFVVGFIVRGFSDKGGKI